MSVRSIILAVAVAIAFSIYAGQQSDEDLTKLMIGAWRSPRHDYVYLADGTWWMGKPEPMATPPQITHGKWWIKDHKLCQTAIVAGEGSQDEGCDVITKLTKSDIQYGHFHMKRIRLDQVDED